MNYLKTAAAVVLLLASITLQAKNDTKPVVSAASCTLSSTAPQDRPYTHILDSRKEHGGSYVWRMKKDKEVPDGPESVSSPHDREPCKVSWQ